MDGQISLFDICPYIEPLQLDDDDELDEYDPEYRIMKCKACGKVYASSACMAFECKEPWRQWRK